MYHDLVLRRKRQEEFGNQLVYALPLSVFNKDMSMADIDRLGQYHYHFNIEEDPLYKQLLSSISFFKRKKVYVVQSDDYWSLAFAEHIDLLRYKDVITSSIMQRIAADFTYKSKTNAVELLFNSNRATNFFHHAYYCGIEVTSVKHHHLKGKWMLPEEIYPLYYSFDDHSKAVINHMYESGA